MNVCDATRRGFLRQTGGAVLSWAAASSLGVTASGTLPNPVGYSIISWPPKDLVPALEAISGLGYSGVQLLGRTEEAYGGDKTAEIKNRLQALRLIPAALSCSDVKLSPDKPGDFMARFREYAAFFHTVGGRVLQLIDGGKPQGSYSAAEIKSMGVKMNDMGKIAKDLGMTVGYHPHFKTFGETRDGLGRVMDATDPHYVGLIADVAHLKLGGSDPAEVIRTYHQRLLMVHLKDVRRDAYELARRDHDEAAKLKARFCEIGTGVVDFPAVTASLKKARFKGWAMVELDNYAPPVGGPTESAQTNKRALRSLGFAIG